MRATHYVKSLVLIIVFILAGNIKMPAQSYTKICETGTENLKSGALDDALNNFNTAINKAPGRWIAYDYRAQVYLQLGKYDEAVADVTKAISLSAIEKSALHYLRANCYFFQGDIKSAIADYSEVINNAPAGKFSISAYKNRGDCYYESGQYENAVKDYTSMINLNSKSGVTDYDVFYQRGLAYIAVSRFKEASADFEKYLTNAPNHSNALFYRGYALVKVGDNMKAIEVASILLKQDPAKEGIYNGLNVLKLFDNYYRRSNTQRYYESAQKSLKEYKAIPSKSLAGIKLEKAFNDMDSAWLFCYPLPDKLDSDLKDSVLNALLYIYPLLKTKPEISENARRYAVQANTATQEKKYNEAIQLWSTVISMVPYHPLSYYNRALLKSMLNKYESAISDMKIYVQLSPDAKDVRAAQDKIYEWEAKNNSAGTSSSSGFALKDPESLNYVHELTLIKKNKYYFAAAGGGSFGFRFGDNAALADFWNLSTAAIYESDMYSNFGVMGSGSFSVLVKPISLIGVGYSMGVLGGLGNKYDVYRLNLTSYQRGYFVRLFLNQSKGSIPTPEFYLQYGFGKNRLDGYYGTMSGNIFNYTTSLSGSAPYNTFGIGLCGKVSGHFFMQLSLDYFTSTIDDITYRISVDDVNNPSTIDQTGDFMSMTGEPVSIKYQGTMFTWMLGFCF